MNDTNAQVPDRNCNVVLALLTGAAVGAGLALWLAPRGVSELQQRVTRSARNLGRRAAEGYEQAGTRVGEAIDELARQGQDVRADVAGAVARGAHEVERFATAAMSDRR